MIKAETTPSSFLSYPTDLRAPQAILMIGAVMYIAAAIFMYSAIEFEPGWFDQTKYLESARGFAAASLAPDLHWYPLLYSLSAAPFVPLIPSAPFAVPNLIAFLAILYALLRIWSSLRLPVGAGVFELALSLFLPTSLFHQFVVPWNTIPVAALLLMALAIVVREHPLNRRSILVLSAVTATVPLSDPPTFFS